MLGHFPSPTPLPFCPATPGGVRGLCAGAAIPALSGRPAEGLSTRGSPWAAVVPMV